MIIERVAIDSVNPAKYNPRYISDEMMERLRAGIREFGLVQPIVCNRRTNNVVGGHQRLKAEIAEGHTEIDVVWVDLDDGREKALNLALNKISGDWDQDMLMQLLAGMDDEDLSFTVFDETELDEMMAQFEAQNAEYFTDEDDVPEAEEELVSRPGDVWILGRHRLMCGDSTSISAMEMLMDGARADMVFTDPPYNVDYEGAAGKIKNDKMSQSAFSKLLRDLFATAFAVMIDGAPIYVAHADGGEIGSTFRDAFMGSGFKLSACLIWKKNTFTLSRSDYQWMHEPILYGWKPGAAHRWFGGRKQATVMEMAGLGFCRTGENEWSIQAGDQILRITGSDLNVEVMESTMVTVDKPKRSELHPTMKPVALVEVYIGNSSRPASKVLDFCAGSGSTLIACEKSGRDARLMEMDPRFADVIVRRWQRFTRQQAMHVDGRRFDDIPTYISEGAA